MKKVHVHGEQLPRPESKTTSVYGKDPHMHDQLTIATFVIKN